MNILVLAAGKPTSNERAEDYPACLTEFDGVPLIEKLVNSCNSLKPDNFIFILRALDVQKYHLDNIVSLLIPKARVVQARDATSGAACTALLAMEWINNDAELLILSSNELVDADIKQIIEDFRKRNLDAGVVTFPSLHPRYSYARLDDEKFVVEVAEKNPISRNAIASFYWFAHGKDFVAAAQNTIRKNAHVDGLFYVAPALNELILGQKRVAVYPIDISQYHPLKTERQMQQYEFMMDSGKVA